VGRLVAEFGVIVVGVLVALLAESWWDERGERTRELATLQRLSEELPGDSTQLVVWGDWLAIMEPSIAVARDVLEGGRPLSSSASLAMIYAAATQVTSQRPIGTWDDLVASGRMADISDADLRRAIVGFHGEFDALVQAGDAIPDEYRIAVTAIVPSPVTQGILDGCILPEEGDESERPGPRANVLDALRTCSVVDEPVATALIDGLRDRTGLGEALEARAYEVDNLSDRYDTVFEGLGRLRAELDRVLGR
jgi:hypothetical protein